MTRYHTGVFAIALGAFAILTVLPQTASAQQMGREGYNPSSGRNPSIAAQLETQRKFLKDSDSSSLGAFQQFVTTYNSSSTSVGNLNSITQNVGDGATASIGQETDQDSTGDQGSGASTDVTQTSDVNTSEALIEALGGNDGAEGNQEQ